MIEESWYTLHVGELPLSSEILELGFDDYADMVDWVKNRFENKKGEIVYLYQYGGLENPIIISANPNYMVYKFINIHPFNTAGFRTHHIHEYESYEDAYAVALDMMEPHELCYNKDNII